MGWCCHGDTLVVVVSGAGGRGWGRRRRTLGIPVDEAGVVAFFALGTFLAGQDVVRGHPEELGEAAGFERCGGHGDVGVCVLDGLTGASEADILLLLYGVEAKPRTQLAM
jgi:hypothetical protein